MADLHAVTVMYTNHDDGIHLDCVCGWDRVVGFDPTIAEFAEAEARHLDPNLDPEPARCIHGEDPTGQDRDCGCPDDQAHTAWQARQ